MFETAALTTSATRKSWKARLAIGLLLVMGSATGAQAQGLGPALEVYADGLAAQRAGILACGTSTPPAGEPADWQKAKAMIVATLWAHNMPADLVGSVGERLDATPPAVDCTDKRVLEMLTMTSDGGWVAGAGYMLGQIGLEPVTEPPTLAQWDEINLAFAEETPLMTRMLGCMALYYPTAMPDMVKFWDDMVASIGVKLAVGGFARPEVQALVGTALSQTIWTPATADSAKALKTDCDADDSWYKRWARFKFNALRTRAEAILGPLPR